MRIIPWLIALLLTARLSAQNCGCEDAGNCPDPFPANSNSATCYDITDAFNNDLASPTQGVCGVRVRFRHGRVGFLNLTLTSPDGTAVQLVGATGNCASQLTPLATWDILFVPCLELCDPDTLNGCAYPCVFDGCPDFCNWQNAVFTGTYQPFSGCLQDFDSGSANGTWCLEIDNNAQFNGGNILDFEVILCDQTGYFCCDADAGNLAFEPNVSACLGDSALLLTPDPIYGALVPDSAEYDYTYAVFQGSNLLTYDSFTNFMGFPVGTYNVCGLSYLAADTAGLPDPGTALTPATLLANLKGAAPWFCGDIDTNCIRVQISEPPPVQNLAETICEGDTFFVDNQAYTLPGSYSDTLPSFGGCDSILNLTLTVLEPDTTVFGSTICDGDSVVVGNSVFKTTGVHEVTLQNLTGCDSTVLLDLTVLPPILTALADTICDGDTVWVGGNPYVQTGVFEEILTSDFGCDSTVTLTLTVVYVGVDIAQPDPDTLTCAQSSTVLNANASTTLGGLAFAWTTLDGHFVGSTSSLTVTVDDPGTYVLDVLSLGCSAADSVTIFEDGGFPNAVATASPDSTLTCATTSLQLDGAGTTGGGTLDFQWLAQNGSPVSDPSSLTPTVTEPDVYQLVVTDLDNGCVDTASVEIFQNLVQPTAVAGMDTQLSCTIPQAMLDGSASQTATATSPGLTFLWSASPGNVLPPADQPQATVDQAGTYQLIVADLENGCQDTDLVVVTVDLATPQALVSIPGADSLTCANPTVTLDGSGSTGSQFIVFQWIGNIATGQGTPVATTVQPGDFSLVVTDTSNGCADTADVTIVQTIHEPQADAGANDTLSCTNISALLGGSGTSAGSEFAYAWSISPSGGGGGHLLPPTDQPLGTADSAGTYLLTVTNIFNQCTAQDTVVVFANTDQKPVADAGSDGILTCQDTTFTLDAGGSTIVPFTIVNWQTASGTSLGSNLQIAVNQADTFILTVSFAFCTSADTAIVTQTTTPPIADADGDAYLDCNLGEVTLDGTDSSVGTDLVYQWMTIADGQGNLGQIVAGATTLAPVAGSVGGYVLTVSDTVTHCEASDTTFVLLDSVACLPSANAGADGLVNCYSQLFQDTLQASGSVGGSFSYDWQVLNGNGEIVDASDPFAPVLRPGEYVFLVTNDAVGLTAFDTVLVVADTTPPLADAGATILPLNCPQLEICQQLDAGGSAQGNNFTYFWETANGAFCSATDVLNAEILGEGIYNLQVTDLDNGCSGFDGVVVQLLDFVPLADAGANIQMLCGDTSATLDGGSSSLGNNYNFSWTSSPPAPQGGTIVSGGDTPNPVVEPGVGEDSTLFFLTIFNTLNLCEDHDTVAVFPPAGCYPDCSASVSGDLTCDIDTVILSGAGSSTGADITYQWTILGGTGNLCGGETTDQACADDAGFYQLTVTRTYSNGASFATDCSVQVNDNSLPPTVDAGQNDALTCADTTLQLNGSASAPGNILSYEWTTPPTPQGGNIVSGGTTANPVVDAPGVYNLLVTNEINGCTATDFVTVGVDTLHPTAEAGMGEQLTCNVSTAILNGSATPVGMGFFWTTNPPFGGQGSGEICAGENSPNPIVCAAGTYFLIVTNPANGCTDLDSVSVTQDGSLPDADAGENLDYTCADTVFTIQATASGGSLLAYSWEAIGGGCIVGATDVLQPTVACPGTYRLTVSDQVTGCSASSVMQVIADTLPPVANAGAAQEINCQTLLVQLDGSASTPAGLLDFLWSVSPSGVGGGGGGHIFSGETTPTPQVDSAGIYLLTVTNQVNQCTDTASVVVTKDANIPVADAGNDSTLTCVRLSLKLDGTGSSVSPSIVYEWTTGDGNISAGVNTLTPTITKTGTYVLEVTDTSSLCVVTDMVQVTLDTAPPTAEIDPSQALEITCAVSEVSLDGSGSTPAGNVSFAWATSPSTVGNGHVVSGNNSSVAHVDSGGWYVLTVTNLTNGCTDSTGIFVGEDFEKPAVQFAPAPILDCDHPTAQLQVLPPSAAPIYSYAWSGAPPILDADTPTPTVENPGVFSVTITNSENGCENEGSLVVEENTLSPTAIAATLGSLDCDNLTVTVTGEGSSGGAGFSYEWATATGGNIAQPTALSTQVDAAGWYFLTVRRLDNGCTDRDSTLVTASSLPIAGAAISLVQPSCDDPEGAVFIDAVLGGTPDFSYSLDGGIFIDYPQFSFLDPGEYALQIQDENGCDWDTILTLSPPGEIQVELGDDIFIGQGESASFEAQLNVPGSQLDTVIWQNLGDSAACLTCLEQTVFPSKTTTYRITVIDTSGCRAEDKITVWVNEERPFFVPTAFSPNGDGINDVLLLFAGDGVATVHSFLIFDRWGNLVFEAEGFLPNDPAVGWDGKFDGEVLNAQVLVWKAEVGYADGGREVFFGDVTLMR